MLRSSTTIIPTLLACCLSVGGCRSPLPCPDCTENAEEADPEGDEPLPDLPCGGADLLTDNENCGSCGNLCPSWYVGTNWEAGTCHDGVCGPRWTDCFPGMGVVENCAELCATLGGKTCIAGGCSGYTALLQHVGFNSVCLMPPEGVMTGACDEPIPWESTVEWDVHVQCCCE